MGLRSRLRRAGGALAATALALTGVQAAGVVAATPAAAVSPDVVISQVYGGGSNSGAQYNADFVELFNRGSASVSLSEMSVQYASATGTGNFGANASQLVVLTAVSLAPGQRYLVGMGAGTVGAALPTPDATGTIAMAAGAGKVALVDGTTSLGCNGGSTPCGAPQLARIRDLVGYGAANFFEGAAATPTLSNTTAGFRAAGGCTDTDNNSADFTTAPPAPRNSAAPLEPCAPVDNPPVVTCPTKVVAPPGDGATALISATDDIDGIGSISITSDPVTGISLENVDLATGSAVLTVAPSTAPGSYGVTIAFATDVAEPQTSTCAVAVTVLAALTPIHDVQGDGASTPIADEVVAVEGIVTSLFESSDAPDGFFLQEENADVDADAETSEGLFVFCRGACLPPAVGDKVRATGPVSEYFGMTQVSTNPTGGGGGLRVVSSGHSLPTAVSIDLPASGSTRAAATFESTEGMVVTFADRLVVSEYFELARYGQLVLTAGARPYQFTHSNLPSVGGYQGFLADLSKSRIILDDNNNNQNDAVDGPNSNEPYAWPQGGLSLTNRVRGGDYIDGLTGVLHWSFAGQGGTDAWRIRPITGEDYTFESANSAPATPDDVGGRLTVTSYNVLNYFATIDTPPGNSGPCGPLATLDCRGADSESERVRQLDKIVAGLEEIDADVAGLIEIQNDTGAATGQIVDALNAATAPGTYAAINTGYIGTDAIKVALVYQPGTVTPVGGYEVFDSSDDPRFDDTRNRPVLIQTFEENATGARFTIAVNHLKSKGSACTGDPDLLDGQGNCNITRTRAAQALADYLETDPTGSGDPDFLVVGDLNSYAMEDPITTLEAAGYTDLHEEFEGPGGYSYVFDGQLGYLDTALANEDLLRQVTGTTAWHINADEVPLFDYNDAILDPGEPQAFERESNAEPLYAADPLRSSDHDPVIVGLDLHTPRTVVADLQTTLAGMDIQRGIRNALAATLRSALKAIDADDQPTACASLQSFLDQVGALTGKKISPADAAVLTEEATLARELLRC